VLHSGLETDNTDTAVPVSVTCILKREQIFERNNILWGDDYRYNRIQTVAEFFEGEKESITEEAKKNIANAQWILRFYEAGYSYFYTSSCGNEMFPCANTIEKYTRVSGVSILRLEYKYDGKIYNLGAVDSISSGDDIPANENWDKVDWKEFFEGFEVLFKLIMLVLVVAAFCALLSFFAPLRSFMLLLWRAVILFFKFVLFVLLLPFRWIRRIYTKK
jgi:hypothetical protein